MLRYTTQVYLSRIVMHVCKTYIATAIAAVVGSLRGRNKQSVILRRRASYWFTWWHVNTWLIFVQSERVGLCVWVSYVCTNFVNFGHSKFEMHMHIQT